MKDELFNIIQNAIAKSAYHHDTDGNTIWVDSQDGKETYYIAIEKCEAQNV